MLRLLDVAVAHSVSFDCHCNRRVEVKIHSLAIVSAIKNALTVPEGCYRTQAIASSLSPPTDKFFVKKDDRTMVS